MGKRTHESATFGYPLITRAQAARRERRTLGLDESSDDLLPVLVVHLSSFVADTDASSTDARALAGPLATAWRVLDGTDGAAPGVEHPFTAALAAIDAGYAIGHVNAYNADVASPVAVQNFWDKTGQLPGFAIGT